MRHYAAKIKVSFTNELLFIRYFHFQVIENPIRTLGAYEV
ncbi:hypothetical protein AN403_6010 [Pseudomonas fluorescens]|uniref:Uncharacterized protein n=1 Tax=Pseudomonas fluorescens TaxID=294 RepID=A0A0P8X750_PSEFL|nr:hypothetical protein AN403_6010 [Pseudomonas fluorescens]